MRVSPIAFTRSSVSSVQWSPTTMASQFEWVWSRTDASARSQRVPGDWKVGMGTLTSGLGSV
jgi:hypothetical protein